MRSYLNFDQFMAEKNKDTILVTIFGKEYEVAKEVPAIVPVMMARIEGGADQVQQINVLVKAADLLLGKEAVDELCAKGLSAKDFGELIQMIFKAVNETTNEDDGGQELSDDDGHKAVRGNSSKK